MCLFVFLFSVCEVFFIYVEVECFLLWDVSFDIYFGEVVLLFGLFGLGKFMFIFFFNGFILYVLLVIMIGSVCVGGIDMVIV